jgi:hypothetical protein
VPIFPIWLRGLREYGSGTLCEFGPGLYGTRLKRWKSELLEKPTLTEDWPEDAWCALKLNALPWPLPDRDIPFDPAILRRLQSGDGAEALRIALHRLQAHGIRPALSVPLVDEKASRSWASALAFPISSATAQQLVNRIQPQNKETFHVH